MERKLTKDDIVAADNLKKIFKAHKKATGKGQVVTAAELNISQSHLSQIMCGYLPMTNIRMLKRLATYFDVKVSDIRTDIN